MRPACAVFASAYVVEDAAVRRDLAPQGEMRVAINVGNTAVVVHNSATDEMRGVAIDLSRSLAEESGLPVKFVIFRSAGQVVDAAAHDAWDVAFLAIDPQRLSQLSFTPPYMQIEGRFMVRTDSPVRHPDELDAPGSRIGVTAGSAYDLFLTRELKFARLERYATSADSFRAFMTQAMDGAAGVAAVLRSFVSQNAGTRILDPAFMTIDQGLAIPIKRAAGAKFLADFMARQIASGRVSGGSSARLPAS